MEKRLHEQLVTPEEVRHSCPWMTALRTILLAVGGIFVWLQVSHGVAQTIQHPLTLDDCVRLAQSAPSSATRARQQVQISRYGITGARANFLPQLSISNNFVYNSPLLYNRNIFSFVALNGVREYSTLTTTTLDVDSSGRLRAILSRANVDHEVAVTNLTLSLRDLRRAVAASYYHVLLARELADSADANLKEAKLFEDRVTKLVGAGEASQADLAKATFERSVLDQAFANSKLESQLATHDLASLWTADVDAPLVLEESLDDPMPQPEQTEASAAYLRRLEFQLFDAQAAGFRADAHQARSQLLPQLSLAFQYGIDATQLESRDRGYAGFVHPEIPVFDWFRAHSESRQFQLRAQQVETDKAVATRMFSKEYADAQAQVKALYVQIRVTDAQVTSAKENLRLSRLRFEGGEGSALEVVTAQNDLAQAQINYYTTRADYLNARVTLDVASGR